MKRHIWTPQDIKNPQMRAQAEAALTQPARVVEVGPVERVMMCNTSAAHEAPKPARKIGVMNKEEKRFADYLTETGRTYKFEAIRLQLATLTTYTPDFYCPASSTFYEVKAWWKSAGRVGWKEDARVKFKTAAALYPEFHFAAVWWRPDLQRFEYEWMS